MARMNRRVVGQRQDTGAVSMDQTYSYRKYIPEPLLLKYDFFEVRNAAAVIAATDSDAWSEILEVLGAFSLMRSDVLGGGGNKSAVAKRLDDAFRQAGWREGRVDTRIFLRVRIFPFADANETELKYIESEVENRGYKVDNFKRRLALDVEWNAKDGNLDRDISAYRALYDAALVDAGIILTRTQDDLRQLALSMDPSSTKFATTTTTNLDKLRPRLTRGDGGGCPILAIAITAAAGGQLDSSD
jgi:hypothetical protein